MRLKEWDYKKFDIYSNDGLDWSAQCKECQFSIWKKVNPFTGKGHITSGFYGISVYECGHFTEEDVDELQTYISLYYV